LEVKRIWLLGFGLAACLAAPAAAEENPFGYSYTADTEEPGETELSLWATDRRGKDNGRYDAQDYRIEAERGLNEHFQVAGYLNFGSHHVRGLEPSIENVRRNFAFDGASVEFKYRLLDEGRQGVGFALYAEPGWSRIHDVEGEKATEYELELKAILSKSFAGGRLVWAGNFTFEPEWEREQALVAPGVTTHSWERELKLQATSGLAYRLSPSWYAGVDARYAAVYPDWTHGLHREASAVSAGPTIAFRSEELSASLTFLPQLFGRGTPHSTRSLGEFEKREIRLKISHEF
jgi:hypothetical protein